MLKSELPEWNELGPVCSGASSDKSGSFWNSLWAALLPLPNTPKYLFHLPARHGGIRNVAHKSSLTCLSCQGWARLTYYAKVSYVQRHPHRTTWKSPILDPEMETLQVQDINNQILSGGSPAGFARMVFGSVFKIHFIKILGINGKARTQMWNSYRFAHNWKSCYRTQMWNIYRFAHNWRSYYWGTEKAGRVLISFFLHDLVLLLFLWILVPILSRRGFWHATQGPLPPQGPAQLTWCHSHYFHLSMSTARPFAEWSTMCLIWDKTFLIPSMALPSQFLDSWLSIHCLGGLRLTPVPAQ